MPELALYDVERRTLAGHLDRVSAPKPVRRKAPAHTGSTATRRRCDLAATLDHGRPWVGAGDDAEQRADRELNPGLEPRRSCSQPHRSMPISRRFPPLPCQTSSAPRAGSRSLSASASASASLIRSPHARARRPVRAAGFRRPCRQPGASPRRSPQCSADRRDTAAPCCAAGVHDDGRASLRATGADLLHRKEHQRSCPLLAVDDGLAVALQQPRPRRMESSGDHERGASVEPRTRRVTAVER